MRGGAVEWRIRLRRSVATIVAGSVALTGLLASGEVNEAAARTKGPEYRVFLSHVSYSATEGEAAEITLRRKPTWPNRRGANRYGRVAKVRFRTINGSAKAGEDYKRIDRMVRFGKKQRRAVVRIPLPQNGVHEPDKFFDVRLGPDRENARISVKRRKARVSIMDADPPPGLFVQSPDPVDEGNLITFEVTLDQPHFKRVEFDYETIDQTATAPADYQARSGRLAIDPGATSVELTVLTKADDTKTSGDASFNLAISNPENAPVAKGMAIGTILRKPPPLPEVPLPEISVEDALPVVEGEATLFIVRLSRAPGFVDGDLDQPHEVRVRARTVNGTAVGGSASCAQAAEATCDFVHIDQELVFRGDETRLPNEGLSLQTVKDDRREDTETFELRLTDPVGATIGRGIAAGSILDNSPCGKISPQFRQVMLNRWLTALDPNGDADGDGIPNGVELNEFAFDPLADPSRFNPLIADAPRVGFELNGDLSIVLLDELNFSEEIETVRIKEGERSATNTDTRTKATTEGHRFQIDPGFSVGVGGGKKPKAAFELKASYEYSKQTTDEHTVVVGSERRTLNRDELRRLEAKGRHIGGGRVDVSAALKNPGRISYRIEQAGLIVRMRLDDGSTRLLGSLKPNFDFGQGPTLAPGQTREVAFGLEIPGASRMIDLLENTHSLEFGMGDIELTEIGAGGHNASPGNYAQYQDRIRQNTAAVTVDFGDEKNLLGVAENRGPQSYFVSTSFLRDTAGRPAGTSLCDALQVLLGRDIEVVPFQFENPTVMLDGFLSVSDDPARSTKRLEAGACGDESDARSDWVADVNPRANGFRDRVDVSDVRLRGGDAVQLVYFKDCDLDGLEHREELEAGSSDDNPDTDEDGLWDWEEHFGMIFSDRDPETGDLPADFSPTSESAETAQPWMVRYQVTRGPTVAERDEAALAGVELTNKNRAISYQTTSAAVRPDSDGDGLTDLEEWRGGTGDPGEWSTDPFRADTNGDGIRDSASELGGPKGLMARYYTTTGEDRAFEGKTPVLTRIDPNIDFNWGAEGPSPSLPKRNFLVAWDGKVHPEKEKGYRFGGSGRGWMRIFANGSLLCAGSGCDNGGWLSLTTGPAPPVEAPVTAALKPEGTTIRVEYYAEADSPEVRLLMREVDLDDWVVVPTPALSPDPDIVAGGPFGLAGRYYDDAKKDQEFPGDPDMQRVDPQVDFTWPSGTSPDPDKVLPHEHFLVRWSGWVTAPKTGSYLFGGRSKDGIRITVNNVSVLEQWLHRSSAPSNADFGSPVDLVAEQRVPIALEYYARTGDAVAELWVIDAENRLRKVPTYWLTPDPGVVPRPAVSGSAHVVRVFGGAYETKVTVSWVGGSCSQKVVLSHQYYECTVPANSFDVALRAQITAGQTHSRDWRKLNANRCTWMQGPVSGSSMVDSGCNTTGYSQA